MAAKVSKGYDYAQQEQKADDLDRWQFANEIVGVILQTSPEWSESFGVNQLGGKPERCTSYWAASTQRFMDFSFA
jgi:hypothetical protein